MTVAGLPPHRGGDPHTASPPLGVRVTREPVPWLLGTLCFLIPAMPTYVVLPGALKGNGAPARMIALIMFGLVCLGFLMVRRTTAQRRVNPGSVILLVYLLLWLTTYGVGVLNLDDYVVASSRTRALVGMIAHVAVGLYIIGRVKSARDRDIVLGCLAAGLGFACFVAFLQSVSSVDLQLLLQPPGFVLNRENTPSFERLGVMRVTGTSQHPIEFSVLAAVTVPLMIYFARHARSRRLRVLAGIGCGLALLALPAAVSRSGIISLLAALLVYMFAFKLRPIASALMTASIVVGAYILVFPAIADALWTTITGSAEDASVESRIEDYARVSEVFREHPIFGLGLGGSVPAVFGYLDNQWLQAIVQGGVVGLTAMVLFAMGTVFGISAALRRADTAKQREQAYMLGAVAVGILASSFTFDLFGFEQAATLSFVVFGLLWSDFGIPVAGADEPAERPVSTR